MSFRDSIAAVNATVMNTFKEPVQAFYNSRTNIDVVFDNEFIEVAGGEVGQGSTRPIATANTSDVSDAVNGTPILIDGTDYVIRETEPDGEGLTKLILEEQP